MPKKCPVCGSVRVNQTLKGFKCKNCGYQLIKNYGNNFQPKTQSR